MAAGDEIILKTADRELGSIPETEFCDAHDSMSESGFAWRVSRSCDPAAPNSWGAVLLGSPALGVLLAWSAIFPTDALTQTQAESSQCRHANEFVIDEAGWR